VREALFRGVLATSRTFLLPASTRRQEEFEVQFVWLPKTDTDPNSANGEFSTERFLQAVNQDWNFGFTSS
jgi:hypothetical protein